MFSKASKNELRGILGYEEKLLVSSDFVNDTRSCIIDADSTMVINSPFYPEPNYNYIKDSRYKTYPNSEIYKHGMPVYKYPYSRAA